MIYVNLDFSFKDYVVVDFVFIEVLMLINYE